MDPAARERAAALERKLATLRAEYRRALPAQLDALAASLAAAARSGGADAALEAWRLAHRLKGTSGSYGFAALAAELEAIETILERPRGARSPASEDEREQARAALERARAALA